MIADTACGYSAFSLMPAGCSIVTVEYKMNVARGEVYSDNGKHVASMQQTLMMLANTPDTP